MSTMIEANCFVGPWEQKRNFSWATIDQVNLNGYTTLNTDIKCNRFNPPVIQEPDDEPRKSIKSASSSSSSSKSPNTHNAHKEINETKPKSSKEKVKKKPSTPDDNRARQNSKSHNSKKKSSCSLSSINKIDLINSRIDSQITQLKSTQKYYIPQEDVQNVPESNAHNIKTMNNMYAHEKVSNYNPSTLYRMQKLQNTDQLGYKRRLSSNLIATLDTNTNYDREFPKTVPNKKCTGCAHKLEQTTDQQQSNFVKNSVSKSTSSNCSCSDGEFDTSDVSFGDNYKKSHPAILQRVKSVTLVRNKTIEFIHGQSHNKLNEMKSSQPILKINKYNNESKIIALKQYSSASIGINRKIVRSTQQNQSDNETKSCNSQNKTSLVKNNNIELEINSEFDNSISSARSRMNPSPNGSNSKNNFYVRKLPPANNATFYGSSINHIRPHVSIQAKYPETISISGKSFLANDVANISYTNQKLNVPKGVSKRVTSAESEIRDIQIKFNQLAKIGVK